MVVHDEETLEEALLLAGSGPVRYSDEYSYIIVSNRDTLEKLCRSAIRRGDVAIVVPQGMELEMEVQWVERRKVKDRRRKEEKKAMSAYFQEHPERVEKVSKHLRKGESGGQT